MIDLNQGDYVLGAWISPLKGGWDWVACVVRPAGAAEFELLYRHRHDEPGDPFVRGSDGKRWIRLPLEGSDEENVLAAVERFLAERGLRDAERVLVRGDADAMKEALAGRRWAAGAGAAPSAL